LSVLGHTLNSVNRDDDRYVTACHEAGHLVAAHMRGVRVASIHVDTHYGHIKIERGSGVEYAFILYAGPWAEARAGWPEPTIDDTALDTSGRSFADQVAFAFSCNTSDWAEYEQEMGGDVGAVSDAGLVEMFGWDFAWPPVTPPDPAWDAELEARWPEVQQLAARMYAGEAIIAVGDGNLLSITDDLSS
jgi:hypothetical protein